MQRNEVISYLKEVLSQDATICPNAITLEAPKDATGYSVHIKGASQPHTIKEIANKRNLSVKEEKDLIIVYKSK
jgi:cell division protein FtsL